MNNSNELFRLIKSLNKNEKGYFKKFAAINSKKGEGNYLRLFDCMDGMKEYDESIIRKKFAGEKFLSQLNVTKLYLQKMIIRALRNYHSENDPEIERLNGMIEAQMLIKKHLYDSAMRTIRSVKAKNELNETQLTTLYLMQLEYQIQLRKGLYDDILKGATRKFEIEKEELRKYENLCHYRHLQGIAMSLTQIEGYTRNEAVSELKKLLDNPLLKDEELALTFKAKMHRFEILNKCYLKIGEVEKALESARHMYELFKKNPDRITAMPYNYFVALNSLVNRNIGVFRYQQALPYIREAEALADNYQLALSDSQRFEIKTQMMEKSMIVSGGLHDFNMGMEADRKLNEFVKLKPIRKELKVTMLYFGATCYFGAARYNEALDRINELVHGDYSDVRRDIVLSAHILNIYIHYNLGNYKILKRLVTLAKNYAVKHHFPKEEVTAFFKMLNSLITTNKMNPVKVNELKLHARQFDFVDEDMMLWWLNSNTRPKR